MEEERPFWGTTRKLLERLNSLDESWFVEIWLIKYYFFRIEIYSYKKEILKHNQVKAKCNL